MSQPCGQACSTLRNAQLKSCQWCLAAKQNPAFRAIRCSSCVIMSSGSDQAVVTIATMCIFSAASFFPSMLSPPPWFQRTPHRSCSLLLSRPLGRWFILVRWIQLCFILKLTFDKWKTSPKKQIKSKKKKKEEVEKRSKFQNHSTDEPRVSTWSTSLL